MSKAEKQEKRTSNPPITSSAFILFFRICSAILSTYFAGSVLRKRKTDVEKAFCTVLFHSHNLFIMAVCFIPFNDEHAVNYTFLFPTAIHLVLSIHQRRTI